MNQLRFNDNKGEVAFFGQKMIILRRDVIRVMRDALERLVGDQAAPFLSFLASGIGIHEGSIFRDSVTSTGEEQRAGLGNLIHSAFEDTNLGWGKVQIRKVDFDKGTASVLIGNCFEAMENGASEEPNCMFTSGFLAGLFAEVFDKTLQAKETGCISQGQAECEFEISPAETAEENTTVEEPKKSPPLPPESPSVKEAVVAEKSTVVTEKVAVGTAKAPEPKAPEKPTAVISNETSTKKTPGTSQSTVDAGVERASRIAQRKQGFWEKHFRKKE